MSQSMLEKVEIAIRDNFNSNDINCEQLAIAAIKKMYQYINEKGIIVALSDMEKIK